MIDFRLDSDEEIKLSADEEGYIHIYKDGGYILSLSIADTTEFVNALESATSIAVIKISEVELNGE